MKRSPSTEVQVQARSFGVRRLAANRAMTELKQLPTKHFLGQISHHAQLLYSSFLKFASTLPLFVGKQSSPLPMYAIDEQALAPVFRLR